MKLNELRSEAEKNLEQGKLAKDELEHSRQRAEQASLSREEQYTFMAEAMEVDEDFRPRGDIISANEAFERSKAEESSSYEAVEESSDRLEEINSRKWETIGDLETYIENNEKYVDSLSGMKDNKFSQTAAHLGETFVEHIAEAEELRDELLTSIDEGVGGHAGGSDLFSAGAAEGTGPAADTLSEEDKAYQAEIRRRQSEAFREKVMSDPMTKNPLFSGVRSPRGAGGPCLTFGINDENLSKLSYAQGNNRRGWGNDCSLAQIANIMTLAGKPTAEDQVVEHVNKIRWFLKSNPASSRDPFLNGGMTANDISRVLNDFGLANDVYEDRGGVAGNIQKLFGAKEAVDLDGIAAAVEEGRGVILGVNASLLNGEFGEITANHAISIVGTARNLKSHDVVGFYINDTGHPDISIDGRLERSQTKFVPLWQIRRAYEVPNAAAILTRGRIR